MKRKLRFSILMLLMAVCGAANAQIWQEDFSSYKNNDVPSGGTYNYVCQNGKSDTKIYATGKMYAGGKKPELLVGQKGKKNKETKIGSFSATIPLNGKSGELILKYKSNNTNLTLSSTTTGVIVGKPAGEEDKTYKVTITVPTGTPSLNITFTNSKSSNSRLDDIELTAAQVAPTSVSVTIGETGYATLYYSDRALTVPAGVKGYTCSLSDGSFKMNEAFAEGQTIPAGTGVLLNGNPGTYTFNISSEAGTPVDDNWLKGSDEKATTKDGERYYMLSLDAKNTAGSVGFYWGAPNGGAFTNGAHKAYLCVKPGVAGAKTCYRFDGQTTAIDGTRADKPTTADGAVYNLAGQRVDRSYKGVVIKNGKKYIQ